MENGWATYHNVYQHGKGGYDAVVRVVPRGGRMDTGGEALESRSQRGHPGLAERPTGDRGGEPVTHTAAFACYVLAAAASGAATVELVSPVHGMKLTDVATCFRWKRPADPSSAAPPTFHDHTRKPLPGPCVLQLARERGFTVGLIEKRTEGVSAKGFVELFSHEFQLDDGEWFWRVSGDNGATRTEPWEVIVNSEHPVTTPARTISPERPAVLPLPQRAGPKPIGRQVNKEMPACGCLWHAHLLGEDSSLPLKVGQLAPLESPQAHHTLRPVLQAEHGGAAIEADERGEGIPLALDAPVAQDDPRVLIGQSGRS